MTQAFNLSQLANFVNTSGQLNAATGLFNQVPVANGGTGLSTVTSGALLLGAGTSAMTELIGTTPSQVISSSPTGWTSVPSSSVGGGNYAMSAYTSPFSYTKPGILKAIKVTVVGAGGNGGSTTGGGAVASSGLAGGGGGGGLSIRYLPAPAIPASPITISAGAGTNSFGAFASATAGANAATAPFGGTSGGGAGGVGSSGTINTTGASGGNGGGGSSGFGGFNMYGVIQRGNISAGNGAAGNNYGSGGSGAFTAGNPSGPVVARSGGAGAPGIVIVEEFY